MASLTCLGFSNIEDFNQSCNFNYLWWIFKNIRPKWCAYQNLCTTFTNISGFPLNFSTSWKSCIKEQWPKKSRFFYILTKFHDLWLKAKKRVEYTKVPEIMIDDWVNKGHTNLNMCSVFGKQIRRLSSKLPKLSFCNQLHPKTKFLCCFWTPTAIKCQNNSVSYERQGFFGTNFRGGGILLTVGGFYNEREYSGADSLVPLISCPKQLHKKGEIPIK